MQGYTSSPWRVVRATFACRRFRTNCGLVIVRLHWCVSDAVLLCLLQILLRYDGMKWKPFVVISSPRLVDLIADAVDVICECCTADALGSTR